MRKSILLTLMCSLYIGLSASTSFENFNTFKKSSIILSGDCNTPTALTSGTGVALNNSGIVPAGGNFTSFVPAITSPNVQYFSVNAAFFGANNAINVDIMPGPAPALSNAQVWIMSDCNGTSGALAATDITNSCFAIAPGNYIIVVASEAADAGNFTITANALTTPPSNVGVSEVSGNTPNDGDVCEGDDFTISTTSNVNYTYTWQLGAVNLPNTSFDLAVVNSGLADGGLYSITITDNNSCSTVITQNIVINTLPTVTINVTETSGNTNDDGEVCASDNFTLTATSGATSYAWTLDGSPLPEITNTLTRTNVNGTNAGVYEVTYTDANGCENTDDVTINVNSNPTSSNTTLKVCGNGSPTAAFTLEDAENAPNFPVGNSNDVADIDNGVGGLIVTYHATLANAQTSGATISSPYNAANNTIVYARIENGDGCYNTAEITLQVMLNPTDLIIQNVNNGNSTTNFTVCEGDEIELFANVTTGLAPYTFQWERPNGATSTTQTQLINAADPALHDGIWNVTVTDANGCTDTDAITVTVTPNPGNDLCAGAIVLNIGNNAGLTNICATQDISPCGGTNSESSVWYEYDIPSGVKTFTVSVSGTNHVIGIIQNNCTTVIVNDCDQSVSIDCPLPQTIKIWVSSSNANEGNFSVNIVETMTTAANDLCANANVLPTTPTCQFIAATNTTTVGACPENFTVAGCALNYQTDPIVWYEFTTPAGTTSIEFQNITAGASLTVFTACPPSQVVLAGGSCIIGASAGPISVAGNTTYYIGIGLAGATGSVGFEIKYNLPPANDACANAITVNQGANNGLTNLCATQDLTPCTASQNQASVWYEYTIPAGVKTLTIAASSANHVVEIYEDNCTTSIAGDCDNSVTLDCPEAQVIKIFISSSSVGAGTFNLTITQTNSTASNDLCANATVISNTPICEFFAVTSTTTVGACPELFVVAGCALNYSIDPVVWYEFTTPPGTTSIQLQNITANAFLTIINQCPPGSSSIAGGACLSGSPAAPIAVSPNTTYYIAIGIDGTPGPVGFEIKYNVTPINDDPCASGFTATLLNGTLAGQDNKCASDDNDCGGNQVDKTLWYQVTMNAPNDKLTINVTGLTNPSIALYDDASPCNATAIDEECSGDGVKEFNCLQPGIYNIMIGSSTANAGVFSVTATQTVNVGPPNDLCANATDLGITSTQVCTLLGPFTTNNVNACPDPSAGNAAPCDFSSEEVVWVSFTAPGVAGQMPTMDFQFTSYSGSGTPFMGLFSGSCGALATVDGCNSGTAVFGNIGPLTAGSTYLMAISSAGDGGGNLSFTLKFNIGPSNDDPCAATVPVINGTGTINGSTSCAGGDPTIPLCPIADQQNVVFYKFTVGSGSKGIDITITPNGASGYSGGIVAGVVQDACGTGVVFQAECGTGPLTKKFECLPEGDYFLQVSTSGATAGDFTITYTDIPNNAPVNDVCGKAIDISFQNCVWSPVVGTTVNACFEDFNVGGCAHRSDPTVFMQFTTPAGATEVDFRNIPAGTYLTLLPDCIPTSAIACSQDLTPFENIPVMPNTTYFIAVGSTNPAGAPFTFDIRIITPPLNDCTPEVIPSGGSPTLLSTCCATNPGDPGSCPPGNQQSTVWFEYQPDPAVKAVEVVFTGGSLSGPIAVEVFTGAPGQNCTGAFSPEGVPYCIQAGGTTITVRCVDFATNSIYVKVGSSEAGCGDFGLSFNELNACQGADLCAEAANFQILMPVTDGACDEGVYCNAGSCAEGGDCDPDGASTWVLIQTDPQATTVVINVTSSTFTPIISAYSGGCGGNEVISCDQVSTIDIAPINNLVAIKIEAQGGVGLGNFTVNACALGLTYDCHDSEVLITRPEYPTANPTGPFCPGETVNMCFDIEFIVSPGGTTPPNGNNCQWIQGIVPTFSNGWDVIESNPAGQPPAGANWFAEDAVEYNGNNNIANITILPNGDKGLCVGCGTPLMLGTGLPAGWWYVSNGSGAGCTNDGDPDNMWGLPAGCGSTQQVNFCINMKVKDLDEMVDCEAENLNFNVFVFADGETGCWQNMSCALALPIEFVGDIDCSGNIVVDGDDLEICTGQDANIVVTASEPGATITLNTIDNPNVTGETLTGTFPNSIADFTDNLVNLGTNIEEVIYVFRAKGNNSICEGPPFELKVTVYPNLLVEFDPQYVCDGLCKDISPTVVGGSGTYVSYNWSNQASGSTINVCPTATTTYFVTVTDSEGCTGTGEVEVEVKPPVFGELDPNPITICLDGVEDIGPYITVNMISGNDPYTYTWNMPFGVNGIQTTTNYDGDTYEVEEETSIPSALPRNYSVNIVDVFGCEVTLNGEISIDGLPDVTFTHAPLTCGQNSTVLTALFDFGLSSSGLDKFELYDCDQNLIATKNNNPSTFAISNLSANNCFTLVTITLNGCISIKQLTVVPPVGTQAIVNGTSPICEGQNSIIEVTNAASFVNPTFEWNIPGLTTPSITVKPNSTTTYSVTVTEPSTGCTDAANFVVVVSQKPTIDLVGSTSFCIGSNTTIEAITQIPGSTFIWTQEPGGTVVSNTAQNLVTVAGNYKVLVTTPNGCFKDSTFTINSSTSLTVNINDLALCDNGVDTLTPGSFFTSYVWAQDGTIIPGQSSDKLPVSIAGLYSVTVSDASGCTGIGQKNVTNSASPNANVLLNPVEVCRVNSGVGPTFINFTTLVSGSAGSWKEILHPGNSGLSSVSLVNITNVSFLGENRDTFRYQFVTNTAILPCTNDSVFVDVIVNNCPCPTINFDPITLCNDEASQVNLNDYLKVPDIIRLGVWSVTGPTTITVIQDSLISINNVASGTYNLSWITNASIGSCQNSGVHTMTINDAPQAQIKGNRFICNAVTGLGASSIDLDSILVAGSDPGVWTQVGGNTVSLAAGNILSGVGLAIDTLTFEYTTNNATLPCINSTITLNIFVRDCNCPIATIKIDTLCNGGGNVNLNTLLTIDPLGTQGTWSSNAVGAVTGNTFNPTGITSGAYKITFTLTNDPGGTCAKSFNQDIIIRRQPVGEVDKDGAPCNIISGNGTTQLGLFSLLKPGYTQGGKWTQLTGTNQFTIPSNGFIDFSGLNPGDVYTFKYEVDADLPCTPLSVEVKAIVKDCNCPILDLKIPTPICQTQLDYNLKDLEVIGLASGDWTIIGPLNNSIQVDNNSTFISENLPEGKYKLRYTLIPVPSGTCDKFKEVILDIIGEKVAELKPSEVVCNVNKGGGENVLDFRDLIISATQGAQGTWIKPTNFPGSIADPTKVDFTNLPVGATYTFTYSITNQAPCVNKTYSVVIEVIDCSCPPIKPLTPKDACTSEGVIDLAQYNDPLNDGTWSSTEVTINNNKLDVSLLASGNYKLTYTVKTPVAGCPTSVDLSIMVIKAKNIGTPKPKNLCNNDPEIIILRDLIDNEDNGGVWKEVSLKPSNGSAFNIPNGTFNTNGQAAGTYIFEYQFNNQAPCADVKQTVTVKVISAPTAQAGNPGVIDCATAEISIGDPTDNQIGVKYEWTHDGGQLVPNADKATTKVSFGGKFTIKVTDIASGCFTTDDVLVTVDPNKPIAETSSKDVTCFGLKNGIAQFINVTGGKAPLQYSKDGGVTFQNTPNFTGLSGGNYKLVIKDATGCTFIKDVVIVEPPLLKIDIGPDTIITLGATVSMDITNQVKTIPQTIAWTAQNTTGITEICKFPVDNCLITDIKPTETTTVCAKVVDINNCISEDCRIISILKANNIVFSNILQPGNGGENGTFYPESESVAWVNDMRIYDRWGNLMFERKNFPSNDPSQGWNGTFNGKDVVPGVYTFVVEIEYEKQGSGKVEQFAGDITVIK